MIAKGLIAKAIRHLHGKVDRIDVVYICSNGDIARQNLNRLAMKGAQWMPASRLTLLAKQAAEFKEVNFVAFTPNTSFDVDGGLGHVEERVLLYQLLESDWELNAGVTAMNVFAGNVDPVRFRGRVRETTVSDDEDDDGPWELHVQRARDVALDGEELGRRPDDLAERLAELALGAPGVVLLRSILRVVNLRPDALGREGGTLVRNGAAAAAWSFRTLFNQPEVVDLLRQEYPAQAEEGYWRSVLRYCVEGCLQAVIDEYTHVLRDHLGLTSGAEAERVHGIAKEIIASLSLRTANLAVDDVGLSAAGRTLHPKPRRMRCHFALRFGDERDDDGEIQTRSDSVRKAFNSPFWPFVVATTSVGQEGLDFHTYCHAVVHWNLPSNPVDMEQREGRVHRFKGHAVRKNVATAHFTEAVASGAIDPWEAMFDEAERQRPAGSNDIIPYWVYTIEGGAQIERHVLAHPLSRDTVRLHALLKSLTLYRMAFGQARQDDLLRYLQEHLPESDWGRIAKLAAIDISPAKFSPDAAAE